MSKSIRQFIGGTLYTSKLGFKKFFPCINETSQETGHTLKRFIELVGLPPSLHSDNLCRWLGPAHNIGQAFSHILLESGEYIAISSVLGIQDQDLFMETLESRIGNSRLSNYDAKELSSIYCTPCGDDYDLDDNVLPYGEEIDELKVNEIDDAYIDSLDKYIGAEEVVPGKDSLSVLTKIRNRKRGSSGNPIGKANQNPILDTRV